MPSRILLDTSQEVKFKPFWVGELVAAVLPGLSRSSLAINCGT
jgi:hypothetical protein